MKRLIAIMLHPWLFYNIVKDRECFVFFVLACTLLGIDKPTIWDVDRINQAANVILGVLQSERDLGDLPRLKEGLFWTMLVMKFKRLTMSRETTKRCLEHYENAVKVLRVDDVTLDVALAAHNMMVKRFECLV